MQMDITINEDILKQTTKCHRKFSCLSGEPGDLCKVDLRNGNHILYVKPKNKLACDYAAPFGTSGAVCLCPTRLELHKRYGI
jgi:hypothetical protein